MKAIVYWMLVLFCLLPMAPAHAQDKDSASTSTRYINLKPAFVVNYGGPGPLRYLKTEIALRVGGGDKGPIAIRHHMPYIRDKLVMLLSKATDEDVSSMEGKEKLRHEALKAVQQVLRKEEGPGGEKYVVDLLFDSFIVQR